MLQDDVAGIGLRVSGRNDDVAAVSRIAPRLAQQQLAQLVVVCLHPLHLFMNGVARNIGNPAGYDTHRRAGVCIYSMNRSFECHFSTYSQCAEPAFKASGLLFCGSGHTCPLKVDGHAALIVLKGVSS
ncbi:hypothetical protein D9M68_912020 [compost metagenome]